MDDKDRQILRILKNDGRAGYGDIGKKVADANTWWQQRRPEIVEIFEREVVGRIPKNVPTVKWSVRYCGRCRKAGRTTIRW